MDPNLKAQTVVTDIEFQLKDSFIKYAMAVIINRALPDVRDGLKPVHRRILYAMHELSLTPDKPYRKSARIVGDVLGKFHPHGESAVYDTIVRMAQPFSMRAMLVDGQGNFGSVDGDDPAAMRYTEARMAKIATELLADIDKDTVDFYPNFDETIMQPTVLPARFPNLLVNGSGGIAVGMATNIPPHNLGETIDACLMMIDQPDVTVDQLMTVMPGPDFPTAATIMGTAGIREGYHTGRGRVVMRAVAEIEPMPEHPNRFRIIVGEIPYQVNKARLVEKIAALVHEKRIEGISDLRDESDRDGMRIVIELKRDVSPMIVLNLLYKHTDMQSTFGMNMLALVDGEPKVLSLRQMIFHYLEHQKQVVTRRTRYEREKAEERAHILQGLLIALDAIDAVIALIRGSRTTAIAREGLMDTFGLSERQAVAILEMRLQRLTGLEREKIQEEFEALAKTIAYLTGLLADEALIMGVVRDELAEIKRRYADERRTRILPVEGEIEVLDLIKEEDMVVTMTHYGYIKRTAATEYRAQRRGGKGVTGLSTREEDFVERFFVTTTHTPIMFFTSRGRMHQLGCHEIPSAGRNARGTAIVNLLQLEAEEKITAVIPLADGDTNYLVMATRKGFIKKTQLEEFRNLRKGGLIAIVLREDDELMGVVHTEGGQELLLGTRYGMCIRFEESNARPMGRATQGVRSVRLEEGDEVVALDVIDPGEQVLVITKKGYGKRTPVEEYRVQGRGGKGIRAMNATDKTGLLAGQLLVHEDEDVMIISSDGTIIRTPAAHISSLSRNTQGVRLMRMDEGVEVVSITRLQHEPEDEGDETADELNAATMNDETMNDKTVSDEAAETPSEDTQI